MYSKGCNRHNIYACVGSASIILYSLHVIQEVADFQHYVLKRYKGVSYYVEKACTINTTK